MLTQQKLNEFLSALHKRLLAEGLDFVLNVHQINTPFENGIKVVIDSDKGIDSYIIECDNIGVWYTRYWNGV